MRLLRFGAILLLVGLFLAGCSSGGGSQAAFTYSGSWKGTIRDNLAGNASLSASMSQSGRDIRGTWSSTYGDGTINSGELIGEIDGNTVVVNLLPSNPATCPFVAVLSRSGDTLSGDYAAYNCTVAISGTISVTKQ